MAVAQQGYSSDIWASADCPIRTNHPNKPGYMVLGKGPSLVCNDGLVFRANCTGEDLALGLRNLSRCVAEAAIYAEHKRNKPG
jgi:hypothetical protein